MKEIFHNTLNELRSPVASRQIDALTRVERKWTESEIAKFSSFLKNVDDAAAVMICPVLAKATSPDLIALLGDYAQRDDTFLQRSALQNLGSVPGSIRSDCLVDLMHSESAEVRKAACDLLSNSGPDGKKTILIQALNDSNAEVIIAALKAIRHLQYEAAYSHLPPLLQKTENPDIIIEVAQTLAASPVKALFPSQLLIDMLRAQTDDRVLIAIAFALGSYESPAHCEALLDLLTGNASPEVRKAAASALARYNSPQVVRTLLKNCSGTDDISLILTCKQALKTIRHDTVLDVADQLFSESAPGLRLDIAILLGELALENSAPLIERCFRKENDVAVRAALIEALGSTPLNESTTQTLLDALNAQPATAYAAISALGENLNETILPRFLNQLNELDFDVFWEAALSSLLLFARSNKLPNMLRETLVGLFASEHRHVAWLAAEVAGWMGMREITGDLVHAMEQYENDDNLRLVVARSLMHLFQNDLLALAEWLAPNHLAPLAHVISREVDLGRNGQQLIRRLALFCSQGMPGSSDALSAAAQLDSQEFAAATEDVDPEAVPFMLRIWNQLDERQKKRSPLKWDHWLTSIDPRLRRAALQFLDEENGRFFLPAVIDLAVNDSDVEMRRYARMTARRVTMADGRVMPEEKNS